MNHNQPSAETPVQWRAGNAPVAVVLITLNEAHHLNGVLENLSGWAQEVFVVDSYSRDDTVGIALSHGARVVQRRFRGFGDQWNFALTKMPIAAPFTMKLDPDERLSDELKGSIIAATSRAGWKGLKCTRRWWFMGKPLPVCEQILRLWVTGSGRFSNVAVNEHSIVDGETITVAGEIEHLDSPDLDHWFEKQNHYSTAEAVAAFLDAPLSVKPSLFGSSLQRRMWLKRLLPRLPFHHLVMFAYYWIWQGAWRAGRVGFIASMLWADFWRIRAYKLYEMQLTGRIPDKRVYGAGVPDSRVPQYD
jgi:hypothetical protein